MQHRGETLFGKVMIRLAQLHRHLQSLTRFEDAFDFLLRTQSTSIDLKFLTQLRHDVEQRVCDSIRRYSCRVTPLSVLSSNRSRAKTDRVQKFSSNRISFLHAARVFQNFITTFRTFFFTNRIFRNHIDFLRELLCNSPRPRRSFCFKLSRTTRSPCEVNFWVHLQL